MRKFLSFFLECIKEAYHDSLAISVSWNGLWGPPLLWYILRRQGYSMILPSELDFYAVVSIFMFLGVTWITVIITRFILAPSRLFYREKERADDLKLKVDSLRIREVEALEALAASQIKQTEERRLQRKQSEINNDPLRRAFYEKRFEQYKLGETFEEETLDHIVFWIANRSAFGRWQDAYSLRHDGHPRGEYTKIHSAVSSLQIAAETGELLICGRQSGQIKMEPISPDFWRNVAGLDVKNDIHTIWKVYVIHRSFRSGESIEFPTYSLLQSDMKRVRELWPEQDTDLDAQTDILLAEHLNNG
jgi:hypothetical protein